MIRQKAGILLAEGRKVEAVKLTEDFDIFERTVYSLQLYIDVLGRAHEFQRQCSTLENDSSPRASGLNFQMALAEAQEKVGKLDLALSHWRRLVRQFPKNFNLLQRHIQVLVRHDRFEEAVSRINEFNDGNQMPPVVCNALSHILRNAGLLDEVRNFVNQSIKRFPTHLGLKIQLALLEKRLNNAEAERECWQAVLNQFHVSRWFNDGIESVIRLGLEKELEAKLNRWREEEPESTGAWWAAFYAARKMKRPQVAELILEKIASLQGEVNPELSVARVDLWSENWRLARAIKELERSVKLWPERLDLLERLMNTRAKAGIFDDFDSLMDKLKKRLGDFQYKHYQSFFFNINCHPDWTEEKVASFYTDWYQKAIQPTTFPPSRYKNTIDKRRRLKIGYLSPDFSRHAVAYFAEPLISVNDRDQFDLVAYAHLEPHQNDSYTALFKTYFDEWYETRGMSDPELARKIRSDGIDILIDLAGHTSHNRLNVMILRPAPVQASWIFGAGQTTGLPEVDYLISDELIIPKGSEKFYAERIKRLPMMGLPFRPPPEVFETVALPFLKNKFVRFGVLARPIRTNRKTMSAWAEILKRVNDSVIRFDHVPYVEPDIQDRIKFLFRQHGIEEKRIEFSNNRPHWKAYQEVDIYLDTFPSGSGTTVSEALFMERLVITLNGRPPMGRISFAQLSALGLAEYCVADSESHYVDLAVGLALDKQRLIQLSAGLRKKFVNSSLMDYKAYGQLVAAAYREMWVDWCEASSYSS